MIENNVINKPGLKFFLLALGAFAGLGLEIVAIGLGFLVFGETASFHGPHWQLIIHWIVTCIFWSGAVIILIKIAKKKLDFDIFVKGNKMKMWQWGAIAFAIILSFVMSYVGWHMNFKIIREFVNLGLLRFIFQYSYYIVETALFLLIIVFGQKAIEIWTKKPNIPWGGIICGLTWGISHIISRGFFDPINGISSTIAGFLFGAAYLLVNRDIKKAYVVLLLMFVI